MIFFDVETTGLIANEALPLAQQPRIIEIGALKTDAAGNELDSFSVLVNPGMSLPAAIPGITGLTDEMLAVESPFIEWLGALSSFFLGETTMIAHNARFDLMCLVFELRRIDKQWAFPFCSVVVDSKIRWNGRLADWGKAVKGAEHVQTHRALADARLLRDCWFSGVARD